MTQILAPSTILPALINGTVIDHIPSGQGLEILRILRLEKNEVSVALNLPSISLGKKDLIKVRHRELTAQETDRVALLATQATIIIVKEGEVAAKRRVQIPTHVHGIFQCHNPRCITRNEPMETRFSVVTRPENLLLQCDYCEVLRDQN